MGASFPICDLSGSRHLPGRIGRTPAWRALSLAAAVDSRWASREERARKLQADKAWAVSPLDEQRHLSPRVPAVCTKEASGSSDLSSCLSSHPSMSHASCLYFYCLGTFSRLSRPSCRLRRPSRLLPQPPRSEPSKSIGRHPARVRCYPPFRALVSHAFTSSHRVLGLDSSILSAPRSLSFFFSPNTLWTLERQQVAETRLTDPSPDDSLRPVLPDGGRRFLVGFLEVRDT